MEEAQAELVPAARAGERSRSRASGRISDQCHERRSSRQNASFTFRSDTMCWGCWMPSSCAFTCVKPPTTYKAAHTCAWAERQLYML